MFTLYSLQPRHKTIVILQRCLCLSGKKSNVHQHNVNENKHKNSFRNTHKMSGWQIHSYDDDVQFSDKIKIPAINSPTEILVKVHATAVNPIDVAMMKGYGSTLLNTIRCNKDSIEFPITLGREFSGKIVQCGMNIGNTFNLNDDVWGVVPPHKTGCHAEYVVVDANCVSRKPKSLNQIEASSVLYAGLTAWSGLFISGNMGGLPGALTSNGGGLGKTICVLGGSGSVGSIAIQIAKAEGARVIASCSTDAIDAVCALGADYVVDYSGNDADQEFLSNGPYDIILDCAGQGAEYSTKFLWKYKNYVTFTSPLLRNVDAYGLPIGMVRNMENLIQTNFKSISNENGVVKWGYFVPALHGIKYLEKLVERHKLKPTIQEVFELNKASSAYQRVADGHLRGKIVIKL